MLVKWPTRLVALIFSVLLKLISHSFQSECMVQRVTLNSCRATSQLVRFVEREKRREYSNHPQNVPQNWGGTEQNHTVTCIVLKVNADNRRKNLVLSLAEFRGP
ncbi:hypothetical protein TNCV_5151 [Trichonephila clavipes]|nr:hypothetical protein TNCV_5151 [Trichonephila clavipes]